MKYLRSFAADTSTLIFSILAIPHIMVLRLHPKKLELIHEMDIWLKILRIPKDGLSGFVFLLTNVKEYRNVFYFRVGGISRLLRLFFPKLDSCYLQTDKSSVGHGLVLQHGFSTIINAKVIGENCQIWHNVTIGLSESGSNKKPSIGNNVKICAGAIVLGDIHIGNNAIIGAGAVVTKNVPEDVTVVGNPAVIIKQAGIKTISKL